MYILYIYNVYNMHTKRFTLCGRKKTRKNKKLKKAQRGGVGSSEQKKQLTVRGDIDVDEDVFGFPPSSPNSQSGTPVKPTISRTMSPLRNRQPPRQENVPSLKNTPPVYNNYNDLKAYWKNNLKGCSDTNSCFKWHLIGLYSTLIEPKYDELLQTLKRAKDQKEITEADYDNRKNNLEGRKENNENRLFNIFKHNNFDEVPISKKLINSNGDPRTELNPNQNILDNSKWITAYENCLFFDLKNAKTELYNGYDCTLNYPIFSAPEAKYTAKLKIKKIKIEPIVWNDETWAKKIGPDYNPIPNKFIITKPEMKAIENNRVEFIKANPNEITHFSSRAAALRLKIIRQVNVEGTNTYYFEHT